MQITEHTSVFQETDEGHGVDRVHLKALSKMEGWGMPAVRSGVCPGDAGGRPVWGRYCEKSWQGSLQDRKSTQSAHTPIHHQSHQKFLHYLRSSSCFPCLDSTQIKTSHFLSQGWEECRKEVGTSYNSSSGGGQLPSTAEWCQPQEGKLSG